MNTHEMDGSLHDLIGEEAPGKGGGGLDERVDDMDLDMCER